MQKYSRTRFGPSCLFFYSKSSSSLRSLCVIHAQRRSKGDYGFNVFHNSNPQHGGSYARHERRMREEEVEDFLKSVKGWTPVWDTPPPSTTLAYYRNVNNKNAQQEKAGEHTLSSTTSATSNRNHNHNNNSSSSSSSSSATKSTGPPSSSCVSASLPTAATTRSGSKRRDDPYESPSAPGPDSPPDASTLTFGDEAIMKTFAFKTYGDAYLFMGRLWAFCYSSDKYPHVTWNEKEITVYLYSPSFKGLSKREARVAAFLNDQYNMLKKSQLQREKVVSGVIAQATVEDMVGEEVKKHLAAREEERQRLVSEAVGGPVTWKELLLQQTTEEATEHKG